MKTPVSITQSAPHPQAIVTLGGGVSPEGVASPEAAARTRCAVALWHSLPVKPLLILSGGVFGPGVQRQGESPVSEAGSMAAIARGMGVAEDMVLCEELSLDTLGNFYFTARDIFSLHPVQHVTVVTSGYHCPRSALIARNLWEPLGITATMRPCPWRRSLQGRWLELRRQAGLRALFRLYDSTRPGVRYTIMERLHPYYGSYPTDAVVRSLFHLMLT